MAPAAATTSAAASASAVASASASAAAVKSEPSPSSDSLSFLPSTPSTSLSISIPSCSAWFSWDAIHDTERRALPEFFDGRSPSRNPRVYKYYRDSVIKRFRANPARRMTFTDARRGVVGDVGSVRRVFEFLETWGLINYSPSGRKETGREKRDGEEGGGRREKDKKVCSHCRSVCSLAYFTTYKADIMLCARCFVCGNYRPGLSSTDFKRVDISEETKTDWTDKETLHLLEAVLQYGEDWKKVVDHVGSRTEKECVARFIKLPFGEQFLGPSEAAEDDMCSPKKDQINAEPEGNNTAQTCPSKRRRLTPLADASNPIMAQVAFLSAMVGPEVAKAAAQAAIAALHEDGLAGVKTADDKKVASASTETMGREELAANGQSEAEVHCEAAAEAQSQLEKEQHVVEQSFSDIVEVQMKEIQEKILRFEEKELQMEKECQQLRHLRYLFFSDQLAVRQHKAGLTSEAGDGETIITTNVVT